MLTLITFYFIFLVCEIAPDILVFFFSRSSSSSQRLLFHPLVQWIPRIHYLIMHLSLNNMNYRLTILVLFSQILVFYFESTDCGPVTGYWILSGVSLFIGAAVSEDCRGNDDVLFTGGGHRSI